MQKVSSYLLIALALTGCDKKIDTQNTLTEYNILGRVKTYSENYYDALEKDGIIFKGDMWLDDSLCLSTVYFFDKAGFVESHFEYYLSTTEPFEHQYVYNKDMNVTEYLTYDPSGALHKRQVQTYDDNGNIVEVATYNGEGQLTDRVLRVYNSEGKETEWSMFDSEGKLLEMNLYKHDSIGNMVESSHLDSKESLIKREVHAYDDMGNEIGSMVFNSQDRFIEKWDYTYDEEGNKTSIEIFSVKELGYKLTYEYDEYGNMTEATYFHRNGTIAKSTSYQYSYDQKGNWVQQIVIVDSEPSYIIEREYVYYN